MSSVMAKVLQAAVLVLLGVGATNLFVYNSQKCHSLTSYTACLNAVNDGIFDVSKCIPIEPKEDESGHVITCTSWASFYDYDYSIDYKTNHKQLSTEELSRIADLEYMFKWASYAYNAKPTDTHLRNFQIIQNTFYDTQSVMGYDASKNIVVTAFRGTNIKSRANLISDLSLLPKTYYASGCTNCKVHSGFLDSYRSIADRVLAYISKLVKLYPSARVIVTGHSLGGAMASLAALDFQQMGYKPYLYTYGCPRVGDANFARFVNTQLALANLRAVFKSDPVPDTPDKSFGYLHGGREIRYFSCSSYSYLAFPVFADDGEDANILHFKDHSRYSCILDNCLQVFSLLV